jgi:hypothetical protein
VSSVEVVVAVVLVVLEVVLVGVALQVQVW